MVKKKDTKEEPAKTLLNKAQYIKDLSFENPRAPSGLAEQRPKIDIHIDVKAQKLEKDDYEVVLTVNTTAGVDEEKLFIIELSYAGLFTIQNFTEEEIQPILLVHCPTLLFPYARRVISDCTRDGGLPPLMVDPIDFAALFKKRVEEAKAANDS